MPHSIISPSSAHIWGKYYGCTGYVTMSQKHQRINNDAADEGEAAHQLCELMFKHDYSKGDFELKKGQQSINGIVFDDEMLQSAKEYFNDICSILLLNKKDFSQINIEQLIDCKSINDLSFGTVDAYFHNKDDDIVYLWDFKFGHSFVDVFENWQLINYASGLCDKLKLTKSTTINFRIVQPRCYHSDGPIRDWTITVSELKPYFWQLNHAAVEALSTSAQLRSGPHCKYCPARHSCKNAIDAGMQLYESSSKVSTTELPLTAMGLQLDVVKRGIEQLKCIQVGLEEQIKSHISGGNNVPGWSMQHTKGRKTWKIDVKEVVEIGESNGFDLTKPQDVITPTQAIKLGLDQEIVDQHTERKGAGVKLIKDEANAALKIFGRIEHD